MTGERTGATLTEWLAAVDADDDTRAEALVATLSPDDAGALAALAGPPDGDRRWWAVRALAETGGDAAVPVLLAALASAERDAL